MVRSGDNLAEIAIKNNVDLDTLREINNLKSDLIFPGQKLKLPELE
jgi:LysM repeat protein